MKLLLAIPSSNPEELAKKTLLWAPRAGFDLRIFTDSNIRKKRYHEAIDEANYQQWLALRHSQLVSGTDPLTYAQENGYDLLVILPPNLRAWNNNDDKDKMVIEFQADLAACRKRISSDNTVHDISFDNGTRVVRVVRF